MGEVGKEVRRLREERGWGQAKLAVEAGTAVSAISQIETGRRNPNSATLIKLARALEVEVADLFPKTEAPLWSDEAPGRRPDLRDNVLRLGELMVAGWDAELEERIAAGDEEWQRRMDQMFAAWARTLTEAALADPDPADTAARLKPIMRFLSRVRVHQRFKAIMESGPRVEELAGRTG